MNILHVTATHLKLDGGVPVVLKNLAYEQNMIEGCHSRVISLVAPVNQMKSPYFDYVKPNEFGIYILKYKPDIVILHSFYYIEYNRIIKILYKNTIPYFIEPHGSFGKDALKKSYLKKLVANNTVFRAQIRKAYGFVFLNNAERNNSVFKTKNDIVIPNGILDNCIKEKIISREDIKFYFIGRYDVQHKGLDFLFDALDILENEKVSINIVMFGKGDSKSIDYLNNRIKVYSHIKVELNESIYGNDKDIVLEQLGPMLLTSRYEGFPMTVLEAWSYGNPCIVTPGTNVYEEITDNKLGWGTSLNPNEIAITIKHVLKDYVQYREEYVINCKKHVKENYIWKNIAKDSVNQFKIITNKYMVYKNNKVRDQ